MAKILNKDPHTFQQEKTEFLKELHIFHRNRGTPFDKLPKIGGREIDLYLLYRRVISFGGLRKIHEEETWKQISSDLRMPSGCCNGSQALKHVYVRYLDKYERVHFHGEDPNKKDFDDDSDHAPARKKAKLPLFGIPLSYNHEQHRVTDAVREMYGLSQDLAASSDYDNLEKSLLSGLPNEVDFVVNVCTLLSNEGRHILRLDQSRYLLTLLMAHIGLFDYSKDGLEALYEKGWCQFSKRNFIRFWLDTVKDSSAKMLISSTRDCKLQEPTGDSVLNLGRDLGVNDKEGQRVTQLAVILRNLSFQDDNCKFMASNDLVFRFLILCINCQYGSLRQLALDTFGNLAEKLIIDDDADKNLILDLISKCISSSDKFDVVRGLEILGKMCQIEENELHIAEGLDETIYTQLIQLACVYDIQLIVHSLETLYQLSELGEDTSTKIASVKNAVDLLVTLLSIEAQSYGPNSLIGIKVVEYCPPTANGAGMDRKIHENSPVPVGPSQKILQPVQQAAVPPDPTTNPLDVNSATCKWLQTSFEVRGDQAMSQSHLYAEYVQFCKRSNIPQILPTHSFHDTVKSIFPAVQVVASDRSDGTKELSYHGLSKRQVPPPTIVSSSVYKPSSVLQGSPSAYSELTQTPLLRQRLLDSPRLSPLQASPSLLPVGGVVQTQITSAIQTPVSSAMTKSKALLQAKLQPRFIQQQQPMIQQGWIQTNKQGTPGAIIQVSHHSHGIKNNVIISQPMLQTTNIQQNLPVMVEGLSSDQVQMEAKPMETKMIKTMLAKKLRPQNVPVPIVPRPKIAEPTPSPMHLLTFTAQQSNVIQGHIQNQPIIPQVIFQPCPPAPAKSPGAKVEPMKATVKVVESSQKPPTPVVTTPEPKRKSTRSSKPASPKTATKVTASPKRTTPKRSLRNSPKSPKTYDLDVCGKIERAKDLTQIGIEAKIEHVENKSVDKPEESNDPSSQIINDVRSNCITENQNIISSNNSAMSVNSSSTSSHNPHHTVTDNTVNQTSLSQSGHLISAETEVSMVDNSVFSKENVQTVNEDCVKKEGLTNGDVEDKCNTNLDVKPDIDTSLKISNDNCVMNGDLNSPDDIIPSPTGDINGVDEIKEVKQAIGKFMGKVGKLNGVINHNGNEHCNQNGGNDLVNGDEELMDCDDTTAHIVTTNGEEAVNFIQAEGVDMVVNEDQLIINTNGPLEVNGTDEEDDSLLMNMPPETSSMEVINAVNSIPSLELSETPVIKNQSVNNIIQPPSEMETIDAVNSILDLEPELNESGDSSYVENTSRCYELVGEPSEDEEVVDNEVIIENEMMLQPPKTSNGGSSEICEESSETVVYQDIVSASDNTEGLVDGSTPGLEQGALSQDSNDSMPVLVPENMDLQTDNCVAVVGNGQTPVLQETNKNSNNTIETSSEVSVLQDTISVDNISQNNTGIPVLQDNTKEQPVIVQNNNTSAVLTQNQCTLLIVNSSTVNTVDSSVRREEHLKSHSISTQSDTEEVKMRIGNEICSTRHVPTPESSRDNELSCDSFASSNTDSDKHSMPSPVASNTQNNHFNISIIQSTSKPIQSTRVKTPDIQKKPSKKRSRSGSGDSRSSTSTTTTVIALEYMCEWSGCKRCFENAKSVYSHVYHIHLSRNPEGYCLWDGCEKLLRKRWSLATHVQDHHCSDSALQTAAIRRFQATQTGTIIQNPRIPALVYPPDAAWQAIRRYTPKPPYPEFTEPREGPVTKHIRLTAALILRNLARYSAFGRSLIKRHESVINYTAMSSVESSTSLANCLWEILHDTC